MRKYREIKDNSNLMLELIKDVSDYDLYVILDAVYQRRLEAKMQIEKIEEGIRESTAYEFWKKIYNDCDQVFIKLINSINDFLKINVD